MGAYEDTGSKAPIIARMLGTNVEEGRQILRDSGLDVTVVETLRDAAQALRAT